MSCISGEILITLMPQPTFPFPLSPSVVLTFATQPTINDHIEILLLAHLPIKSTP